MQCVDTKLEGKNCLKSKVVACVLLLASGSLVQQDFDQEDNWHGDKQTWWFDTRITSWCFWLWSTFQRTFGVNNTRPSCGCVFCAMVVVRTNERSKKHIWRKNAKIGLILKTYCLTLLFCASETSRVIVLTFKVSLLAFFLILTSNPLQASNIWLLHDPRCFFSHTSNFFFFQSSLSVLSSFPVSQQFFVLCLLQIWKQVS